MKALTPWKSTRDLETLRRDMDDVFHRLTEGFFGPWKRERSVWGTELWEPSVESHVENGNLIVRADLPGVNPKEVTISVAGNR